MPWGAEKNKTPVEHDVAYTHEYTGNLTYIEQKALLTGTVTFEGRCLLKGRTLSAGLLDDYDWKSLHLGVGEGCMAS